MITTDRDSYLWVTTTKGKEIPCVRVCGAVAWGDDHATDEKARNHAMVVGGEHRDGSLQVFDVFSGPWLDLIPRMIAAKDDTWALQWWVDPSAQGRLREVYRVDGLTFFADVFPPEDRGKEHKARIAPWWKSFTDDLEGGRTMVDKLRAEKLAKVDQSLSPFQKAFHSKAPEQLKTAVSLAAIALIWHLWQTSKARVGKRQERPDRWPWEKGATQQWPT